MKAKLTWTDPNTRIDGATLAPSEIDQIAILGSSPGSPSGSVAPGVQEFTTGDLSPGTYEWHVEVWAVAGGKKSVGVVVSVVIPVAAEPSNADLSPVTNLTATVVP